MFKKLLSNLDFNPSLIGQVSFYAKRMHNESNIRRAGFVMIFVAMLIQSFAVFSPPQASLQASPNTDLINGGFRSKDEALKNCKDNTQDYKTILANFGISCSDVSDATVTNISPNDHDKKLYSMGRLAFGTAGETPIHIPGAGKFYVRHFWSLNHAASYKALKVTNSQGKTFYLLYECGNIVSIGIPTPPPPVDVCTNVAGLQTNKADCDVCKNKPGVQLKPADCDVCPNISGVQKTGTCDVCPDKAGTQATYAECDVCPKISGVQTNTSECVVVVTGCQSNCTPIVDLCPEKPGTQTSENDCKPCAQSQTRNDLTACLDYKKAAKNVTAGIADANNTTAKAGDVIEYTLTTTNNGKVDIKGYEVNEGIGDVLDYADVVDLHGGIKGEYDNVAWPKADIKAGKSLINIVTVKIKSPIPATPISSSDPQHFNMVMTNVYGNTINIQLPASVTKTVEIAATQIPNTGPGTSLLIGFSLSMIIAFFFMRSRLLAKELDIVRADFGSTGGY